MKNTEYMQYLIVLEGFFPLPFLQNMMLLMSMEFDPSPMGWMSWAIQKPCLWMCDNSPRWSSVLLECATAGNAPAEREETGTAFLKPY